MPVRREAKRADHTPFIPIPYDWPAAKYGEPAPPDSIRPKGRWGGPRPNSGPPRGNLNALKHGRTSRQHRQLLERLVEIPDVRDALVAMAQRNRRRVRQAEEQTGVLLAAVTTRIGEAVLSDGNDQENNDQLFTALANLEAALKIRFSEKRPRSRRPKRKTTRNPSGPTPP